MSTKRDDKAILKALLVKELDTYLINNEYESLQNETDNMSTTIKWWLMKKGSLDNITDILMNVCNENPELVYDIWQPEIDDMSQIYHMEQIKSKNTIIDSAMLAYFILNDGRRDAHDN